MTRVTARNTGHTLTRVHDHIIISVISTSAEVTLNSILTVLRCHMIILLTLVTSHNMIFLRVDINIMILVVQKNVISYDKINLSRSCKN